MNKDTQTNKPKRQKKSNIILRILALLMTGVLLVCSLLLVVYRDELNLDALKRWMTFRDLDTTSTGEAAPFTHAGGDRLSLAYLEHGILTASEAGAHYYSFAGDLYAEEILAMENPVLSCSGRDGVVYDAGGQSLFLFREQEEVSSLSLEGNGDLLSARINSRGWLTVTAQQSGFKGAVTVYNDLSQAVIEIKLSSTFVVDAVLSPDCKTVAVVTVDQSAGSFRSQLLLYPVNQKEPSLTVDLGGIVPLDLDFERDLIWILGEDRLLTLFTTDGSVHTYSFGRDHLKGCDLNGEGFAMLLTGRYRNGSASQMLILGPDAAPQHTLPLNSQVLDYSCAGNYCALLSGSRLTIYDRTLTEYACLDSIQGALHTDLAKNGSALLANDQQAWLYIPE